jgi:hypothetical protein
MNRNGLISAVLCLALASQSEPAAGAVRVTVGGAAASSPATLPINLGSQPLGTIQAFVAELCFYQDVPSHGTCDAGGSVSLVQGFTAPFYTAGIFRKILATGQTTPVTAPVTLAPGERLILINEWIATTPGPASSTQVLSLTQPGESAEDVVVDASGNVTAAEPCGFFGPGLCLSGGRFQVQAHFVTSAGVEDSARGHGLTTDTGYFFFFDPANVEAVVKVLDGCGLNARYWFFAGGLTDVRTEITVLDLEHDTVRVYFNPQGKAFQPIQDTAAFATCP